MDYTVLFLKNYVLLYIIAAAAGIVMLIFLPGLLGYIPFLNGYEFDVIYPLIFIVQVLLVILWYRRQQRKGTLSRQAPVLNAVMLAVYLTVVTAVLLIKDGSAVYALAAAAVPAFPFALESLLYSLMGKEMGHLIKNAALLYAAYLISLHYAGRKFKDRRPVLLTLLSACMILISFHSYSNRPEKRYAGHGFKYMNGFSSTDFSDYYVYSEPSKLAVLDHEASFRISDPDDMPVLDGAEACYPVYAAAAKAVYENIAEIEKDASGSYRYDNGVIVTFTNTVRAVQRLADGEVDMVFGARTSEDQRGYASEKGVALKETPIGREAFVFFTEEDNPVDGLTSQQIRSIYHGDITNWKDAGGKNQKIVAFQRPENSGSQTMMKYFMGDVSLKEPITYEYVSSMEGVLEKTAEYHNEAGAIGYTFRYFLTGLHQEKNVKILSVDGVFPTAETISDGSYPLTTNLYCITREGETDLNVQKMLEFLLSDDGQYLIEATGYAPLN